MPNSNSSYYQPRNSSNYHASRHHHQHHHHHGRRHRDHSNSDRHKEPVFLNIYDMLKINGLTMPLGLGVFHTGVEVYGVEFTFVTYPTAESGIFEMRPRDTRRLGEQVKYRESIRMGRTRCSPEEVRAIVDDLGHRFGNDCYHMTKNNSNHFSSTLTRMLVGRNIPAWVNRLSHIFSHLPLLRHCLPKDKLRPAPDEEGEVEVRHKHYDSDEHFHSHY